MQSTPMEKVRFKIHKWKIVLLKAYCSKKYRMIRPETYLKTALSIYTNGKNTIKTQNWTFVSYCMHAYCEKYYNMKNRQQILNLRSQFFPVGKSVSQNSNIKNFLTVGLL